MCCLSFSILSLWAFETLISIWFGYEFVTCLIPTFLGGPQRLALGIPLGFFSFSWIMYFAAKIKPLCPEEGIIYCLSFTVVSFVLKIFNIKNSGTFILRRPDYILKWTIIMISFIFFINMFSTFLMGDTFCKGAACSDLPFHLNIAQSIAQGCNHFTTKLKEFKTVFYSGVPLAYPIIPNFQLAALMATGGASPRQGLLIPSLLMAYSLMISIYEIAHYFTCSRYASILSIILFVCLGGLGFLVLLDKRSYQPGSMDFVHHWNDHIDGFWLHPLAHILLPQRSSLWAMPLCYWAIYCLIVGIQKDELKLIFISSILVGFTPQGQAHAYMSMAQWSIAYAIFSFPWRNFKKWPRAIFTWAFFAILANIMAIPQAIPFLNRVEANSNFMKWNPVWNTPPMYGHKFKPITLWWQGLGVFWFIAIIAGWTTVTPLQATVYIPSIIVFVIGNVIRYQEWEMDNIKVFYDAWIPIALPFVSQFLISFLKRAHFKQLPTFNRCMFFLLVGLCVASGVLCNFIQIAQIHTLYEDTDIQWGFWVQENTPVDAIFLTASSTEQPTASIGGRQIFYGYPGWVVSHGLDDGSKTYGMREMLNNPNKRNVFQKYNVTYVVDEQPRSESLSSGLHFDPGNESVLWEIVYEDSKRKVYHLIDE